MHLPKDTCLKVGLHGIAAAVILCAGSDGRAEDNRIAPTHTKSNSILSGPARGPCDKDLAGPDYVAGTDVYGRPVTSADVTPPAAPPQRLLVAPRRGAKRRPGAGAGRCLP